MERGGSATLNLGLLSHTVGGTAVFVPPWATAGSTGTAGTITTTANNDNGILGGWALLGNGTFTGALPVGTNWACVDANGKITNYAASGFDAFNGASANMAALLGPGSNILITMSTDVADSIAAENAGTTTDINSLMFLSLPETPPPSASAPETPCGWAASEAS